MYYIGSPPKSKAIKDKEQWRTESIQTLTTISDDDTDAKQIHNNPVVITSNNKLYTSRNSHNGMKPAMTSNSSNNRHYKHSDNNNFGDNLSVGMTSQETSPTQPSSYRGDSYMSGKNTQESAEPRIVAPNVSKLSPQSVIEVRLQSLNESVAVLCSVDVLKMRSGFFHQVLAEQERHRVNKSVNSSCDNIWREPITIPETSPYEAAAFLESLHEGRAISKGEWNYCWSRLSVNWITEDLATEYAQQIEKHIHKLCCLISDNNWRTNPQVLAGMRIAAFKKGITPTPTIAIGTVIDATNSTPYSKVRVSFDTDKNNSANNALNSFNLSSPRPSSTIQSQDVKNDIIIGEISEPFWIQCTKDSPWMEPDELFYNEAKRLISSNDKRVFWEMVRAIIEMPELSARCNANTTRIRDQKDLAAIFKKQEFKILWTSDASHIIPKEAAAELITAAYVITPGNMDA